MKLNRISYRQHLNTPNVNPWILENIFFNNLSLVLGKNATGKSKLINLITALTEKISSQRRITEGEWDVEFLSEKGKYRYYCCIRNEVVNAEIS